MDYSKLSDLEINGYVLHRLNQGKSTRQQQLSVASGEVDYCNKPADAWPIIEENCISIRKLYGSGWRVCSEWGDMYYHDSDNPLRAGMIVYLMMQEGK